MEDKAGYDTNRPHRYLMDEHPHFFYPSLAERLGLNEAIVLQQIHSWIQTYLKDPDEYRAQHYHDGFWWVWDSYPDWHKKLPYLSESTIRRTLIKLRERGILKVGNYNVLKIDRTFWYAIDYDAYDKLWTDHDTKVDAPSCQNGQMEDANLDRPLPSSSPVFSSSLEEPPAADSPADDLWPERVAAIGEDPAQEEDPVKAFKSRHNPIEVMTGKEAERKRAEVKHPDFTDASKDSYSWAGAPLMGFQALIMTPVLSPSDKRNWPTAFMQWAQSWEEDAPTPDETYECIKGIKQSEYRWMTFKTPYEDGFKAVMNVMLGRLRAGQPWDAGGDSGRHDRSNGGQKQQAQEQAIQAAMDEIFDPVTGKRRELM